MTEKTEIRTLDDEFCLKLVDAPFTSPGADVSARVDAIWKEAVYRSGNRLFDGDILCFRQFDRHYLECQSVPYRFFFAQRLDKMVQTRLQLKSIAVSGLIIQNDRVILGKRGMTVTQYPNHFELVPSGSVDLESVDAHGIADYKTQLKEELVQELSLDASTIDSIIPFALVQDKEESTYDICCRITLVSTAEIKPLSNGPNSEYSEVITSKVEHLRDFVKKNQSQIVPTSIAILEHEKLI